ncbi:MAG: hypothetical protein K2N34_00630 [Lachnospiraceae bacterium]|nr:hypothetical protein [Lachnospiraceae bacterium]
MPERGKDVRVIQHSVSCVLVLYDELTGRPINRDRFEVQNQQGQSAVYKENGIYVFIGKPDGKMIITIDGSGYQKQKIAIQKTEDFNVHRIWMMPSIKHTGTDKFTVLTGRGVPFSEIKFILLKTDLSYKLLHDIGKGDTNISFYHLPNDFILGREFRICDSLEEHAEDIRLIEEEPEGEKDRKDRFLLEKPITLPHIAEKTQIYRVNRIKADETGEFFALFRNIPVSGCRCMIEAEGKQFETELKQKQIQRYVIN